MVRFAAHCGALAESIDELLQMCRDPGVPGFCLSRRLSTLVFHESAAVASASYDAARGAPPEVRLLHPPAGAAPAGGRRPVMNEQLLKLVLLSEQPQIRGESREMLATVASEFDLPEGPRDAPDHLAEEHLQRT